MKRLSMFVLGSMLSVCSAQAVEIAGVKLDAAKENLIVTVRHGGGCGEHNYELVIGSCLETMPVQCTATIKHTTSDFCEAYLTREAKFNLKKLGLNGKYYAGAALRIVGDGNTRAAITLPSGSTNTVTSGKKTRCITHTGSDLVIGSSSVSLTTTDGEKAEYQIVDTDVMVIETYPSILQTVYKLNDGRSLETEFTLGETTGTGQFIRVDRSRSPEFSCIK